MEHGDDYEAAAALMACMRDPEEGRLVAALDVARDPVAARAAYAAWLRGRGDPRAEVLELAAALDAAAAPDPAQQARLDELLAGVSPGWWRLVRARRLQLHCGEARAEAPAVRFRFLCPASWEELAATGAPDVRHCARCREDVHRCDDLASAEAHARAGHCISVSATLVDRFRDPRTMITGRPEHPVRRWSRALFGDTERE